MTKVPTVTTVSYSKVRWF